MKYELINEQKFTPLVQVLTNRGIEYDDLEHYCNPTSEDLNDWSKLGDSVVLGCNLLYGMIEHNKDILIVVDCDCDGYSSAAILINFLYDLYPDYSANHISYFMHDGKQHGLKDVIVDDNIGLVICPDSSSNDYVQHQELNERDIAVLILDHHDAEKISECAFVVNNQLSDYPNKSFSGAGVTWQFCKAFEELFDKQNGNDKIIDKYLDLAALGNCGDMMDYRSIETKYLIDKGFKNVHNPFFYSMSKKNSFSMHDKINYTSVAWYVTPYINAVVRSGTQEEKDLIFKSMLNKFAFDEIPSTKRGHKGETETVVEQAVRTATNVKNRQTKLQNETLGRLEVKIQRENLLEHGILIFKCEPGEVEKNIAGLVANKYQAKYQRPCLVLIKSKTKDDKEYFYRGSARNYNNSPIEDFRQVCLSTNLCEYAEGHASAFGFSIPVSKIDEFIKQTDEIYSDVPKEPMYHVDFIFDEQDDFAQTILDIGNNPELWGQEISEPLFAIEHIKIYPKMIVMYDKGPTIKISLPNGVSLMLFKSSQEEYDSLYSEHGFVDISIVGTANVNEYMGSVYPQLFIEDYNINTKQTWEF